MAANINYFKDRIDWEGSSIEKLTCDKSIPVNDRIFALGRCVFTDKEMVARIWSFECFPKDTASLSWVIKNEMGEEIRAEIFKNGSFSLKVKGQDKKDMLSCYTITGEDLQGEYWGGVFSLPLAEIETFLNKDSLVTGDRIYMEFRKEGENLSSFGDYFKILK